jgi:hypothetical protein
MATYSYIRAAAAANAVETHGDLISGTNGVGKLPSTAKIASKG